jgi:quinol---cytochrome-c reductase cytochrome b subunit
VSDELVEVWRQADGTWRWRYLVTGDHTHLRSNRGYHSVEEAVRSARQAYPGVQVMGAQGNGAPSSQGGMLRIVLVSAVSAFALLALRAALGRLGQRKPRRD